MKNVSKVLTVCAILLAAFLTSCDKEIETSPLTLDQFQKAKIIGTVYAELDLTSYGYEYAPAGTKVIVTMSYSQLGINTSGSFIDTLALGANGNFEIELPADANEVSFDVKVVDFAQNQTQEFGENDNVIYMHYYGFTENYSAKANDTKFIELYYGDPDPFGNYSSWVTISGVMYAETNNQTVGQELLNQGTQVTFTCDGWSNTVTLGAGGTYSVDVPIYESIYVNYNFTHSGKLGDGTNVTWRFEDVDYVGYPTSDSEINLYLGTGVTE